ncbi:MAG: septum formation family protein [Micropruina sp.]|nr:septum formation family protein [Micropruina sp.]
MAQPGPYPQTSPPQLPPPSAEKSVWLQPGGISAIAAVLAVLVTVISLWATRDPAASTATPPPSQPEAPAIFVYGSSMPGQSRYDRVEQFVVATQRDSVDGLLYDSGLGYPMAKFGPGGEIPGFVLKLDPATADNFLREQTRLESGLFHPMTIRTRGGVTATAYEWIDSTDGYPRIERWDGSTAGFGAVQSLRDLSPGDCFQNTPSPPEVITMWCDAPHSYQVFHTADLPQDSATERQAAAADGMCAAAFSDFVGIELADSSLSMTAHPPDAGAWEDGERLVVCTVHSPGETTSGTLQDAKR